MANIIVLSLSPSGIQNCYDKIDLYVEFIPFFVFRFLVKVTKKGKKKSAVIFRQNADFSYVK